MERNEQGQYIPAYRGGRMNGWERGMDNRRANHDMTIDKLRNIVNADVLASGRVRRRRGISQTIADANAHSVFGTKDYMYWATQSALRRCDANFTPSTLKASAFFQYPLSYVELHDAVYVSNEYINGKVVNGVFQPWGVVPPAAPPTVVCMDDLTSVEVPRDYKVTCTFIIKSLGVDVEESGAPVGAVVHGADAGVLSITNIPQSTDTRVTHTRLYVTDIDGTEYFAQADIPTGITSYMVSRPFAVGKQLKSLLLTNVPCGQLIEFYNGRFYIAQGQVLFFTPPLYYGAVHASEGYYLFPERITLLKAVNDGLYLSSDGTYFLQGTPERGNSQLQPSHPYRAIEGAATNLPNSHDVMWLSDRGVMRGSPGGKVENLTEDQIAMDAAPRGCMGVIEYDGARSAVAIMQNSTPSAHVSKDYLAAEQDRKDDQ